MNHRIRFVAFITGALSLFLVPGAASARADLMLTIVNDSMDSDLSVIVKGSTSKHDESIGIVPKGGTSSPYPVPVKDDTTLTIVASMPNGGFQVDTEPLGARGRDSATAHVSVRDGTPLAGDAATALITDITKAQGNQAIVLGTAPYDGAINSMMGEMVLYDASDPTKEPLVTLPPSTFATPLTKADMDLSGTFSLNNEVKISTTSDLKLSATIPAIVALGATVSAGDLYDLSYSLNTAGPILPKAGSLPDFVTALEKIPSDKVKVICKAGATAKTPRLFYITKMWGVGGGSMDEKTAKTADASITASGNVFVSGNAAYDFTNSDSHLITVTATMLNYGGDDDALSVLCTPDASVTTTVSVPSAAASNSGVHNGAVAETLDATLPAGGYSAQSLRDLATKLDAIHAAPTTRTISVTRHIGLRERYLATPVGTGLLPQGAAKALINAISTTQR